MKKGNEGLLHTTIDDATIWLFNRLSDSDLSIRNFLSMGQQNFVGFWWSTNYGFNIPNKTCFKPCVIINTFVCSIFFPFTFQPFLFFLSLNSIFGASFLFRCYLMMLCFFGQYTWSCKLYQWCVIYGRRWRFVKWQFTLNEHSIKSFVILWGENVQITRIVFHWVK